MSSGTRAYVITDPRMSDAGFLKVTSYAERLGGRITMISQRQWLFGLWRTYEVLSAEGPLGRRGRYTLLEAVGRLWLLKARSEQVIY